MYHKRPVSTNFASAIGARKSSKQLRACQTKLVHALKSLPQWSAVHSCIIKNVKEHINSLATHLTLEVQTTKTIFSQI